MESARLLIRPMEAADKNEFVNGIKDRALRTAYGFPVGMDDGVAVQIFHHFCALDRSYSLVEKRSGKMIGFLLTVSPELPDEVRNALPEKGRTLAYAVFPPFQRQGYMLEALQAVISELFGTGTVGYIHCGHFEENVPGRELLRKLGCQAYASHKAGNRLIIDEILICATGKRTGKQRRHIAETGSI